LSFRGRSKPPVDEDAIEHEVAGLEENGLRQPLLDQHARLGHDLCFRPKPSVLGHNGKVLRLSQVVHFGLSLEEPDYSHDSTVAMGVAGFLVLLRTEKKPHQMGIPTYIRFESDRPLEVIEERGSGFQIDDAPLDSLASHRQLFAQLAPDSRTISNAVWEKPITLSIVFGSLGRLEEQVMRTCSWAWSPAGCIDATASQRLALTPSATPFRIWS